MADYEALPEVSEAMVTLAMICLMLHRLIDPNKWPITSGSVASLAFVTTWPSPFTMHRAVYFKDTSSPQ